MAAPSELKNKQFIFVKYAKGFPDASHFQFTESTVSKNVNAGDVLLQNLYISVAPYLRERMKEGGSGYADPFELNKPVVSDGIGRVVTSANPVFKEGDLVQATVGWEEYTLLPEGKGAQKLDPEVEPPAYLGVLGLPGLTAYVGFLDIGQPKEGETVFVSAASGGVGQVVGQLAKLKGCYVVGSVGSDEKVRLLKDEFGYDAAFNYNAEPDLDTALQKHCPKGIDIYFDNVGGKTLDTALANANNHARFPVREMISQYNLEKGEGVHNLVQILAKRIKLQGFVVNDHIKERYAAFAKDMLQWVKEGKVKHKLDITKGLKNTPKAFFGIFTGENVGKAVVQVAE